MPTPEQPAALKLLTGRGNGTDSGGRKVKAPPNFKRIAPKAPPELSDEARAEWDRVVPGLARLDILKPEDRGTLAAYCEAWSTFVEATLDVRENGITGVTPQGIKVANPSVTIARNAAQQLRMLGALFGLSPSAEMALGKVTGDGEADDNPFSGR